MTKAERKEMIKTNKTLSIQKKCQMLKISSSGYYYRGKGNRLSAFEQKLHRDIDELHIKYPTMGSRQLRDQLRRLGYPIGRQRVRSVMKLQRIRVQYPRPRTSKKGKGHKIYPYLLGNVKITRMNQVWVADITYIPMERGFVYLVAIMDLWSRKILTWRTSVSLESDFCVEALKEALKLYGTPEIFNTDQGSQFTCDDFIEILKEHHIRISMDGKGRWIDNVFIERFWRTLKYDEVYLKAYETVREARDGISSFIHFYNAKKTHSSLDCQTPDEVYFIKSLKDNVA